MVKCLFQAQVRRTQKFLLQRTRPFLFKLKLFPFYSNRALTLHKLGQKFRFRIDENLFQNQSKSRALQIIRLRLT